jgi:hypothetical protein
MKFYAEPHLCVACDEVAKSKQKSQSDGMKSAYAGGVYHTLQEHTE